MKTLPRIAIVDDEQNIVDMLTSRLRLEGYSPVGFTDPTEALKEIQKGQIQIVVTDVMMPEMDGVELLRLIKRHDPLIQVIIITGYVTMSNIISVFRNGANNVLFKPFESIDVVAEEVNQATRKLDRISEVLRLNQGKKSA